MCQSDIDVLHMQVALASFGWPAGIRPIAVCLRVRRPMSGIGGRRHRGCTTRPTALSLELKLAVLRLWADCCRSPPCAQRQQLADSRCRRAAAMLQADLDGALRCHCNNFGPEVGQARPLVHDRQGLGGAIVTKCLSALARQGSQFGAPRRVQPRPASTAP